VHSRGDRDNSPNDAQLGSTLEQPRNPRLRKVERFGNVHLPYPTFVVHPGHLGDQPELPVGGDSSDAARRCHGMETPPYVMPVPVGYILPGQRILMHC
jgi:hypothetical protein